MKKTRQRYDLKFKISVVTSLSPKNPWLRSPAKIAFVPALPLGGETSWPRIPKEHLAAIATVASTRPRSPSLRGC